MKCNVMLRDVCVYRYVYIYIYVCIYIYIYIFMYFYVFIFVHTYYAGGPTSMYSWRGCDLLLLHPRGNPQLPTPNPQLSVDTAIDARFVQIQCHTSR